MVLELQQLSMSSMGVPSIQELDATLVQQHVCDVAGKRTPFLQFVQPELGAQLQHHRDDDRRLQRLSEQYEHRGNGEYVVHCGVLEGCGSDKS